MCPFCYSTATMIVAGLASAGGAATFVTLKLRNAAILALRSNSTPSPDNSPQN